MIFFKNWCYVLVFKSEIFNYLKILCHFELPDIALRFIVSSMKSLLYISGSFASVFCIELTDIINCFRLIRYSSLTVPAPNLDEEKKLTQKLNFPTSLWCLKRFYERLKALYKTFSGSTKKWENKNLWVNCDFNATFWNARGGKG